MHRRPQREIGEMCGLNYLKFGWSRGGVVAGQRSPSFEEDWIAYDRLPEAQKVNLPEKTGLSLEFFETEFGEIDGKQFKVVFSNFLGPCHHQVLCKGPVVDDKVHDFFWIRLHLVAPNFENPGGSSSHNGTHDPHQFAAALCCHAHILSIVRSSGNGVDILCLHVDSSCHWNAIMVGLTVIKSARLDASLIRDRLRNLNVRRSFRCNIPLLPPGHD